MPLYACRECWSVENTATGGYWAQQMAAHGKPRKDFKPLCSACNPAIGKWHDDFPRRRADSFVESKEGFIYSAEEAAGRFKHVGPFKPLPIPPAED